MVLLPEAGQKIEKFLFSLLGEFEARYIMLAHRSGTVISTAGNPGEIDVSVLSVLASAAFSSTCSIAEFLGEKRFGCNSHVGENHCLQLMPVGDSSILVFIFDSATIPVSLREGRVAWVDRFSRIVDSMQTQSIVSEGGLAG